MKAGVYVLPQFPFIFVSAYIYKLEKEKNTSWMREVCYWQLKSQIPADQHSRAGPNSQPTMTRIHNKWCNQTCSSQLKLRTKQISIMRSQHLTNNTFDVKRRNMITRLSLVMNRTVVDSVSRFHLTTCAVEAPVTVNHNPPQDCRVPQMIPYRKWSRDRKWSPKWTANDPQPQVISTVDRKWSRENLRNGMDFMGLITKRTDYKKRNLFLAPSKEKGKEDATSQVNLYKAKKKWNKSEEDMVSTVYFFLCRLPQFSFKNVSSFEKFKRGRTLRLEAQLFYWGIQSRAPSP